MHLFSTPWKHVQGVEKGCIRNERVQRKGRTTGSGELWTVGFEVMQFLNVSENQCYSYCRTLNTKSFFYDYFCLILKRPLPCADQTGVCVWHDYSNYSLCVSESI